MLAPGSTRAMLPPVRDMNLLLFKVHQLGENVAFVSVVQQLRRTFPASAITLFTSPEAAPLYGGALAPHHLVPVERSVFNNAWRRPLSFARFWWHARRANARACILTGDQGSVAHFLSFLTVTPVLVGSAEIILRLPSGLTHLVRSPAGAKNSIWNWEMGRALAAAFDHYDWPMQIPPPDLSHLVTPQPTSSRGRIVIDPGASFPYRRWPIERFAELARRFAATHDVVWITPPSSGIDPSFNDVLCVPSHSLAEVTSIIAASSLFIGNHNSSLQLASALGIPGVTIAGPVNREWDPTWHSERFLLLRVPDLACQPCEQHRLVPGRCTNQSSPLACLDRWSVDEVERLSREWLKHWTAASRVPFPFRKPTLS